MILPFYQVEELFKKGLIKDLQLQLDLTPPEVSTPNPMYYKPFSKELFLKFTQTKPDKISFVYNPHLKDLVLKNFPDYFQPIYSDKISMIRMILQQFEIANSLSRWEKTVFRKRVIKSLTSVQDKEQKYSVIKFNSELKEKDLEYIKNRFSDDYIIPYTVTEKGILLVTDTKGYKENPSLSKLQFQVRKVFNDIRYKRILTVDASVAFAAFFKPVEDIAPKLVVLCGETNKNLLLFRLIKIFDPFAKIMWLGPDDLKKDPDEVFDLILPKLGSDYSYESLIYDPKDTTKELLSSSEAAEFRERIGLLGRSFSIKEYISIEFELLEKMKKFVVHNQLQHLYSVLEGNKLSKEIIFTNLLEGSLE